MTASTDPENRADSEQRRSPRTRSMAYGRSLARMRAALADPAHPLGVRALARRPVDEPAIALLDSWAIVTDIVSFYTERLTQEGFLGTATELESVRELVRTLGHELRPGIAAEADLAFSVEETVGSPETVTVPRGTPVQSIPGQDQTPQVFETETDLEARAAWNAIPAVATSPQRLDGDVNGIWLTGLDSGVRPGDSLVVVDGGRAANVDWAFLLVTDVAVEPDGRTGWTLLTVRRPGGTDALKRGPVLSKGTHVYVFAERANLFGWNAQAAQSSVSSATTPPPEPGEGTREVRPQRTLELDGDHPRLLPDSWLVVESDDQRRLYRALAVTPSGNTHSGFSARTTRVSIDGTLSETLVPRSTMVHCQSVELPAERQPRSAPVAGRILELAVTEPLLPVGRVVVVQGTEVHGGAVQAERAQVSACTVDAAGTVMTVTLDRELDHTYRPDTVAVLGNAVTATHGETVSHVLGSGDGAQQFTAVSIWRQPLTYVRGVATGAATSTLAIRVDGELWHEVASLHEAGPNDRVFVVRNAEGGTATAIFGDGVHGARLPTGSENITATYRVGNGAAGAVAAGQLTLIPRRPLGISAVVNPMASRDWASAENLGDARAGAPRRTRTLDRVVSVDDYKDFAQGFAGVGAAQADVVWDGNRRTVVLSLIGDGGRPAGDGLLAALGTAIASARPPGGAFRVMRAAPLWFGVRIEVLHDPDHEWTTVREAVVTALGLRFAPARQAFGAPVTTSAVLMVVKAVAGVAACGMPRLLPLPAPPVSSASSPYLPPDTKAEQVLASSPAHWEKGGVRPARFPALAAGAVEIAVMAP
ncbi:putative baseplate assembly protein [Streptomyces sp. TX20-6-3]|uniref:putative baseplate assembly protein n=1 Tax=Streptomyces sp. TX20-6-3 TaxID=3028705 RepID=UPI0029BE9820|nr:putative baseplate assembly protein [Streptomyces sp. TX20-6-3]MDX2562919.1 putative baseplate assembly protein [Streptomyces sp. TX20-6-3]